MDERRGRGLALGLGIVSVGLLALAAVRGSGTVAIFALAAVVFGGFYVAMAVGMSPRNEVRPEVVDALRRLGGGVRNKQHADVTLEDGRVRPDIEFAYHRYRELSFGRRRYRGWTARDVIDAQPRSPEVREPDGTH